MAPLPLGIVYLLSPTWGDASRQLETTLAGLRCNLLWSRYECCCSPGCTGPILSLIVGDPATVPDHISLWGSLLLFRREFDQYINLRPCRLISGVTSPLANRDGKPIDFVTVRENTEGEYSSIGGRIFEGTDRETVIQNTVFTRMGVDRVIRYAIELARTRPAKKLTSATKSNGISITMPYWDERVEAIGKEYPDIKVENTTLISFARISCSDPTSSTLSWALTYSATFCPTLVLHAQGQSALRRRLISTLQRNVGHRTTLGCPVSSNLFMGARLILPERESPILWV